MNFRELRNILNLFSEKALDTKVTVFSKYWNKEEEEILLSSDGNEPYLYAVVDREKNETAAAK